VCFIVNDGDFCFCMLCVFVLFRVCWVFILCFVCFLIFVLGCLVVCLGRLWVIFEHEWWYVVVVSDDKLWLRISTLSNCDMFYLTCSILRWMWCNKFLKVQCISLWAFELQPCIHGIFFMSGLVVFDKLELAQGL